MYNSWVFFFFEIPEVEYRALLPLSVLDLAPWVIFLITSVPGGSRAPRWAPQYPSCLPEQTVKSASGPIRLQHCWDHVPFSIPRLTGCHQTPSYRHQSG